MTASQPDRFGSNWNADEVAAIVDDYFDMFDHALEGRPYVKALHNRRLQGLIGRSGKSIEYKHQNISAVLADLGLPWLPGYKPKHNYQKAILPDEIAKRLHRLEALSRLPIEVRPRAIATTDPESVFDTPPRRSDAKPGRTIERLIRKFDPAARDERNRDLGRAGEDFVVDLECRRLHAAGRPDLERRVRHVSAVDGDGAGYDILSFDARNGSEALIEVKTTCGGKGTPFFLTRNEEEVSRERASEYRLYRVFEFGGAAPRILDLRPPLGKAVNLTTALWSASFR